MTLAKTQPDSILSTPQAARLLHRSAETVRAMIARGDLPAVLIAGRWWVDAEAVAELAARERRQA